MANSSSIPAALDALVSVAKFALAGTDAQVLDGGPVTDLKQNYVCIGFTGTPGEVAVTLTQSPGGLSAGRNLESYDVACQASSWLGEQTDAKAVRDRAFELVDLLAEHLVSNHSLSGAVMRARMFTTALIPEQTTKGAVATVGFTIHIDAFTR